MARKTDMKNAWTGWTVALAIAAAAGSACAQGIFTCVDAKGRKITSDRPILECNDREQKELNSSGSVKRQLPPSMTAAERAAEEAKTRKAQEDNARAAEERRRDRALATRYPNQAAHDKERALALKQIDDSMVGTKRDVELAAQQKKLDAEMEFYKGDASRAPPALKRQMEEHQKATAAYKRFIADKAEEKKRVNARFDEELVLLKRVWSGQLPVAASSAAPVAQK
jgi:Domain of unknown function (DUF4124)